MDAKLILERLRKEPFEPFRVHLKDGTHHDITRFGVANVTRRDLTISIGPYREEIIGTRFVYCYVEDIVRLEPLASTADADDMTTT